MKCEIIKVHLCSLILYLYYTTQHYFCQVKIMLSPLGVVLWNTQGGLFWDKVCRIEIAPANILYKNISVQSALCWMYHPLIVGHEY